MWEIIEYLAGGLGFLSIILNAISIFKNRRVEQNEAHDKSLPNDDGKQP